jgi:hypothetical protein
MERPAAQSAYRDDHLVGSWELMPFTYTRTTKDSEVKNFAPLIY